MRKLCLVVVLVACICGSPALAAEPVGEWLVANGDARIRIEPCANALWGVIAWTREPGIDSNNPDPAKREPLHGRRADPARHEAGERRNKWEGEVYNAQNGKMYSANISLVSDDVLKIQGCVLGGIFCGGENWTRGGAGRPAGAPPPKPGASRQRPPRSRSPPRSRKPPPPPRRPASYD